MCAIGGVSRRVGSRRPPGRRRAGAGDEGWQLGHGELVERGVEAKLGRGRSTSRVPTRKTTRVATVPKGRSGCPTGAVEILVGTSDADRVVADLGERLFEVPAFEVLASSV